MRNTIDLSIDGIRGKCRLHLGLNGIGNLIGQVHRLARLNYITQLLTAACKKDVRRRIRILQGRLELAIHIFILNGFDLDMNVGILLLISGSGVFPELLAVTGGGILPHHNFGLSSGAGISGAAGSHAQYGGHGQCGRGSGFELHCLLLVMNRHRY